MIMRLLRRVQYWLHRRRHERELAEEMDFHRAMTTGPAFGNATLAREDARSLWIGLWLDGVAQDLRYAVRSLRRDPAFTIVALGALGAAIGLNTSLFTTFNGVMWRPWPVPPTLARRDHRESPRPGHSCPGRVPVLRTATRESFSGLVATRCIEGIADGCTVRVDDPNLDGAPLQAEFVSRNYFDVLAVGMSRGTGFRQSGDGDPDAVAVLSDTAWRLRFGADPGVVGRLIHVDDVAFTVAGVAPAGFEGTQLDRKDLWIPLDAIRLLRPDFVIDDAKRFALLSGRLADGGVARAGSKRNWTS